MRTAGVNLRWIVALTVCLTLGAAPGLLHAQSVSGDEPNLGALDPQTVVVLPFANISGDSADAWIGAGIADTVAADLGVLGLSSVVAEVVVDGRGRPADDGLGLSDETYRRSRGRSAPWRCLGRDGWVSAGR